LVARKKPETQAAQGFQRASHVQRYAGSTISGWSIIGSPAYQALDLQLIELALAVAPTAGLSAGRSTSATVPPARIAASARAMTSRQ
jgi:hypothetical protein